MIELKSRLFKQPTTIAFGEFVALMAVMTSLIALTIDAILPVMPLIGSALDVSDSNDLQWLIMAVFLGLSVGQLFYGPLSDYIGRKPAVYIGLSFFFVGSLVCLLAQDLTWMLAGRMLQGFGLAGPRSVSMAIVRDQYEGDQMAKVMSFVMAVFIVVPAMAPALGQAIAWLINWQSIFFMFVLLALGVGIWFAQRQPETLPPSRRAPFSAPFFTRSLKTLLSHPVVVGYTLAAACVSAPFVAYLSMSQQIFQIQYALHEYFPLVFAALALAIGCASVVNGKLVSRVGMGNMAMWAVRIQCVAAMVMLPLTIGYQGHPPFALFIVYCVVTLFCVGILFGNLNAMAMTPVGHIAGLGAAVVGSLSTLLALPASALIGAFYNGTVMPLVMGFGVFSVVTWRLLSWVAKRSTLK